MEAPLEETEHGLVCRGDGWFVANARDLRWYESEGWGRFSNVAGDTQFRQLGIGLTVLGPGQPLSMYHWEIDEEDFLILSGAATLIVDGQERPLCAWDFVHCPPNAEHTIVGGPCVVFSVGSRTRHAYLGEDGSRHELTTQDAQVACFENAAHHLEHGGCFVIEVGVPDLRRLPPGERYVAFSAQGIDEYDVATQGLISHHFGPNRNVSVPFRYVWPSELDLMARGSQA